MSVYEERLLSWNSLREQSKTQTLEKLLLNVNDWWQMLPMDLHYLHWDDVEHWPDPWELLADGIFCPTAKSLGMVYTLHLINHPEINDMQFAQTRDGDNLVLINQGKYIINWAPGELLNTRTSQIQITETMATSVVTKQLN